MKVLKVIVAVTMLFAAKQASALVDVAAFGGYTILNPTTVNLGLDTKITSGYYAGVDADFSVLPFLKVGPRVEYLSTGQGKIDYPAYSMSFSYSLLMVEGGVNTSFELPLSGLSVGGGAWLGYGILTDTVTSTLSSYSATGAGSAGGFVGEVGANIKYKIIPTISAGLDLGYRMANISSVDLSGINIGARISFGF